MTRVRIESKRLPPFVAELVFVDDDAITVRLTPHGEPLRFRWTELSSVQPDDDDEPPRAA